MGGREGTEEGRTDGEEVVVFSKRFPRKTGNPAHKGYFCPHNVGSEFNHRGFEILGKRPQAASEREWAWPANAVGSFALSKQTFLARLLGSHANEHQLTAYMVNMEEGIVQDLPSESDFLLWASYPQGSSVSLCMARLPSF